MSDALDKLIVDESESLDINLLASLVSNYLKFTKEGEMIFEKYFYELKDWQKLLIYLLARKAILVKKLQKNFEEKISPAEISRLLGIKAPTIRKYVSKDLKGIIKSENGKYFVPNYNLFKCEKILKK